MVIHLRKLRLLESLFLIMIYFNYFLILVMGNLSIIFHVKFIAPIVLLIFTAILRENTIVQKILKKLKEWGNKGIRGLSKLLGIEIDGKVSLKVSF